MKLLSTNRQQILTWLVLCFFFAIPAAAIDKLASQDPRRAGTAAALDARIAEKRKALLAKRKDLTKVMHIIHKLKSHDDEVPFSSSCVLLNDCDLML